MHSARAELGPYTLIAEIARGGMGVVYLAQAPSPSPGLAVVKLLKSELAEDPRYRTMFIEEARLAARVRHRNIVQTEELGQDGPRYYFVMEYLEGRTLESVLRLGAERGFRVPTILRIACDVLAGLHHAHEVTDEEGAPLGLVHRDVSPQNVFLTYDGHVKLLDFGVAKAFGRAETDAGVLRGRVSCMAPDHLDDAPVDRRADVFSVGLLLREALTGRSVWGGRTEVEILRELIAKRIPPFPADAQVAPEVRSIIEKAMAPQRDDRFRTAHAMRAALEQHVIRIDPGGSLAEVGSIVSREFAEHRAHVKAIIGRHVAEVESPAGWANELPVLPLSASVLPGARESAESEGTGSSGAVALAGDSEPRLEPSGRVERIDQTATVSQVAVGPPPSEPAPRRAPKLAWVVLGLVAVGIAAASVFAYARRGRQLDASASLTAGGGSGGATAAAGSARESVPLTITATPAEAQILIDDVITPGNPWRSTFPRGTTHTVRAVAAGHASKTETLTLTATTDMTIMLDRLDAPPAASVVTQAALVPDAPPHAVATAVPGERARAAAPAPALAARRLWGGGLSATKSVAAAAPPPVPAPAPAPAAASAEIFGGGRVPSRTIDQKTPYE